MIIAVVIVYVLLGTGYFVYYMIEMNRSKVMMNTPEYEHDSKRTRAVGAQYYLKERRAIRWTPIFPLRLAYVGWRRAKVAWDRRLDTVRKAESILEEYK